MAREQLSTSSLTRGEQAVIDSGVLLTNSLTNTSLDLNLDGISTTDLIAVRSLSSLPTPASYATQTSMISVLSTRRSAVYPKVWRRLARSL
jgi:hypothetical protein